jgi:hypothetical protein
MIAERYTAKELDAAFSLVADEDDWRLPVCKVVPADADRELISAAVRHFTGGAAEFKSQPDGAVLVTADGYYLSLVY